MTNVVQKRSFIFPKQGNNESLILKDLEWMKNDESVSQGKKWTTKVLQLSMFRISLLKCCGFRISRYTDLTSDCLKTSLRSDDAVDTIASEGRWIWLSSSSDTHLSQLTPSTSLDSFSYSSRCYRCEKNMELLPWSVDQEIYSFSVMKEQVEHREETKGKTSLPSEKMTKEILQLVEV